MLIIGIASKFLLSSTVPKNLVDEELNEYVDEFYGYNHGIMKLFD